MATAGLIENLMSIEHLAILGGPPEFAEALHVGRPNLPNRAGFERRLAQVLDSGWLTNDGPMVRELEDRVRAYLGVEHCIAVANATVGLELLMRALELKGEIILPSFTFIATAHAVSLAGLTPVFCDIDPETHNLDPRQVENLISENTAAILGVHVWGRPCAVDELEALSHRTGVPLLFDAAHAFACSYGGRMIGGFGRAEVFSLHATKFFHSFEGGLITTEDPQLAHRIRQFRNFGFAGYDQVVALGTNAKMSEAHAAMGLANLEKIDLLLEHNARNIACYIEALALPLVAGPANSLLAASNFQYVIASVRPPLDRDRLMAGLQAENVLARRYFSPGCHQSSPYSPYPRRLVQSDRAAAQCLALPTGLAVGPAEIEKIAALIARILESSAF